MPQTARVQPRLWRIYRRIDPGLLGAEGPAEREELDDLSKPGRRTGLAWGTYSRSGLEHALRAYGTLSRLEARGVGPVELRLSLEDPFAPRVTLFSPAHGRPVVDLSLRQVQGQAVGLPGGLGRAPVLYLESILLQDPGRRFDWLRPPLPEQEFPGLALGSEVLQLLLLLAKRVGVEALALRPSTFHAARVFARYFRFVSGRAQGRFEALRDASHLRPLWLLSWALELGCARREQRPFAFDPEPMVAPLTRRVGRLFASASWQRARKRAAAERFTWDLACLRRRFPWSRMPAAPPPGRVRDLLRPAGR